MERDYETTNQDSDKASERESFTMRRTIRSTVYDVKVYFSRTSSETLADKILRMIRNEAGK